MNETTKETITVILHKRLQKIIEELSGQYQCEIEIDIKININDE